MSDHTDLHGIRWTEDTELEWDDDKDRIIPADEAESYTYETGPHGVTPWGLSWHREKAHCLKDPARHYRDEQQHELFVEDYALSQARGGRS